MNLERLIYLFGYSFGFTFGFFSPPLFAYLIVSHLHEKWKKR